MKKYSILRFKNFEKDNNDFEEIGANLKKEEIHSEIEALVGRDEAILDEDIRIVELEDQSFGIAAESVGETISDMFRDNLEDGICYDGLDFAFYEPDIDAVFEDEEVKAKMEELAELINKKANISYYTYTPWESITYKMFCILGDWESRCGNNCADDCFDWCPHYEDKLKQTKRI